VKNGRKAGPVSDRPFASYAKKDRSKTGPTAFQRPVSIRNAHPRLHVPRPAVARAIAVLDEHFEMLPGDLPSLTLPPTRLAVLKSRIENLCPVTAGTHTGPAAAGNGAKSKIRGCCPVGELSLVFLTDPALAKIHGDFMHDPSATDVITFDGDPLSGLAGEICVSADTAWKYVGSALEPTSRTRSPQAATLQREFAAELTLYVVHGWLHLSGYDDLHPPKKRRMRAAESRAMKLLAAHQAIPPFRLK
jgi:probable rRNA maturation factor